MHGLRHLQLVGNKLSNQGLQAILDGCPYLESLDLRNCYNVNLEGDLGKRCAEQIKNLKRPEDSMHDYQFADAEMNNYHGLPNYSSLYPAYHDVDVFSLLGGYDSSSSDDCDDDGDSFDYANDDDAFDEHDYDVHLSSSDDYDDDGDSFDYAYDNDAYDEYDYDIHLV
ncbi:hypothetical protein PTKIN_Ptkin10aG0195800 [Pterospermum kingtungense]